MRNALFDVGRVLFCRPGVPGRVRPSAFGFGGQAGPALLLLVVFATSASAQTPAPAMETVTLDQAVERAIKNNPTVAQASQGILRAEGLLQQARSATLPFVTANVSSLVNSTERRFDDVITSPRTQATLSAQLGMPVLAASRWAATAQAR